MKKTILRKLPDEMPDLGGDMHPILQRIYAARGVRHPRELDTGLNELLSWHDLKGIDQAANILIKAIQARKSILIVADFDCDGATSCAVAMRGLQAMGAANVRYLVPNRFEFGYGLTPEIVDVAADGAELNKPDLLITVDNGIASVEGVRRARELGIDVVITDHHLQGGVLPDANAIVNPNQQGDEFGSKHLAGVGVIFYVLMACRAGLRQQGWFEQQQIAELKLADLLDLVALGTVADLVPLDSNNRILVEQGLRRIRAGQACPGIYALLQCANRDAKRLRASDLAFAVAPRLNAAGRLEDMGIGIECLLSPSEQQAARLAQQLDQLNQERKAIETDMREQAFSILNKLDVKTEPDSLPDVICLYDESWHQGVIGILASRIKERLHRPVIIFAPGQAGEIKGSARSIPGVHIRDMLDAVSKRYPGLIDKFGGHAMAAGLTIQAEHFQEINLALTQVAADWIDAADLQGCIQIDGELSADELQLSMAELVQHAGPWGQGFAEPIFNGCFRVVEQRIVGEKHLKLILEDSQGQVQVDAIAFFPEEDKLERQYDLIQMAYRLDVNEFRGQRRLQLLIEDLEYIN